MGPLLLVSLLVGLGGSWGVAPQGFRLPFGAFWGLPLGPFRGFPGVGSAAAGSLSPISRSGALWASALDTRARGTRPKVPKRAVLGLF